MKYLINFVIVLLVLFPSISSYADGLICNGKDSSGTQIHLIMDVDTATININGRILKITPRSGDGKSVSTESYKSDTGILTKGILTHREKGMDDSILSLVNAETNKTIVNAYLECKRY